VVLLCVAATAVSVIALKLPAAWVWITLAWTAVGFRSAARSARWRTPLILASSMTCAIGLVEAWFWVRPASTIQTVTPMIPDANLGWRVQPNLRLHATLRVRDSSIYDALYTTDMDGHRPTPPGRGCVWITTCSFPFGVGVPDSLTFPYLVGAWSGRHVVNLGVPGYGLEHVVALLEHPTTSLCAPSHVIYLAIPDHIQRAAHRSGASQLGPRYERSGDSVIRVPHREPSIVARQFLKSRLVNWVIDRQRWRASDIALYAALTHRVPTLLHARYPDARWHVLWWPDDQLAFWPSLWTAPNEHSLAGVLSGDIWSWVWPHDGHPTAAGNAALARYVVDSILTPGQR
jgi:hypothetical protein